MPDIVKTLLKNAKCCVVRRHMLEYAKAPAGTGAFLKGERT